tara:strand:+ start:217 stop:441 length:225 start_codon:yes stop_codon:yes gene_type:complete
MEKWLSLRGNKETRVCDSCGTYKLKAIFYNWYNHPALKGVFRNKYSEVERIGVICTPCAKREAGSNNWDKIKNG